MGAVEKYTTQNSMQNPFYRAKTASASATYGNHQDTNG